MAKNFDYRTCSNNAFIKHLEEINPKESTFTEIFTQLNEIYIEYATEIMKINEQRVGLLENIRYAQKEYKRLLGHTDNKPVDSDDNKIDQEIVEPVQEKRGRKKTKQTEQAETAQDEDDDIDVIAAVAADSDLDSDLAELENIPKMKSDVKGKKGKPAKNVEAPVIVESGDEAVMEVKKAVKKTPKKAESIKEVKEVKEVEQVDPVQVKPDEVKKVTKKTNKKVEAAELADQVQTVQTVQTTEPIKEKVTKKKATAVKEVVEEVAAVTVDDTIVTKKAGTGKTKK